ncbi:hypothetical protein DM02DRAFT_161928 [Periconia macrospinosa]|uniref:F-box domain-containing protein n=1 Tax=Periconia macrospinosa TaxID=97972 RepID=A0A2V1E651_9PLEO|nr:hypothetical protein DM02DRAFT_161928 [Periconia macrospinosa]
MLLDIPPEMRLRIYELLLAPIPLSKPPSQFTGLLFSCRQIRHELEHIIVARMQNYLLRVQRRCAAMGYRIQWLPLRTFNDAYNLTVFRGTVMANFKRKDPFMVLFYLYLGTLTIKMRYHRFGEKEQHERSILAYLNTTISYHRSSIENYRHSDHEHRQSNFPVRYPDKQHIKNITSLHFWITHRFANENTPAARRIICDWSTEPIMRGSSGNLTHHRPVPGEWNIAALENGEFGALVGIEYSKVGN